MSGPARPLLSVAVLVVAATLTAACGSTTAGSGVTQGSPTTAASSAAPTSTGPSPTPSDPGPAVPADVRARPEVAEAIADAADRQSTDADAVTVASFAPVTWNDGSLGCPQKDMAYTQATVEGERLVLDVGGTRLAYHGRTGGPYAFCANPTSG